MNIAILSEARVEFFFLRGQLRSAFRLAEMAEIAEVGEQEEELPWDMEEEEDEDEESDDGVAKPFKFIEDAIVVQGGWKKGPWVLTDAYKHEDKVYLRVGFATPRMFGFQSKVPAEGGLVRYLVKLRDFTTERAVKLAMAAKDPQARKDRAGHYIVPEGDLGQASQRGKLITEYLFDGEAFKHECIKVTIPPFKDFDDQQVAQQVISVKIEVRKKARCVIEATPQALDWLIKALYATWNEDAVGQDRKKTKLEEHKLELTELSEPACKWRKRGRLDPAIFCQYFDGKKKDWKYFSKQVDVPPDGCQARFDEQAKWVEKVVQMFYDNNHDAAAVPQVAQDDI